MTTTPESASHDQWRSPKQVRHQTHEALAHARSAHLPSDFEEWDDAFIDEIDAPCGSSMRSRRHTKVVDHPKGTIELTAANNPKVWKLPFWKRRSSQHP